MKKIWFDEAWDDYLYWQTQDKKTLKRINALIQDIERSGFDKRTRKALTFKKEPEWIVEPSHR